MLVCSDLCTTAGDFSASLTCYQVPVCFIKHISTAHFTGFQMWFLCFGTMVNKMRAMAWKRLQGQDDTGCDTSIMKQFWRHPSCFRAALVRGQDSARSLYFVSHLILVKWFIILPVCVFLPNRLFHSDFHTGRRAGECDGVSPRAEPAQGDRPGAWHGVDGGLHW